MKLRMPLRMPRNDWLLVLVSAALFVVAYPPFHFILPSFLCLIPAVALLSRAAKDPVPIRRSMVQGFWFGWLTHGAVLYWMVFALWHFTPLSLLGYVATITILAIYSSIAFGTSIWIERETGVRAPWSFAVFFLIAQLVVDHQGDIAFPWLGLGSSLSGYPLLVQIADVIGARGVGALLVLANVSIGVAFVYKRDRAARVLAVSSVMAGVVTSLLYGVYRMRTVDTYEAGTVALLQPNVGFREKWEGSQDSIFRATLEQSRLSAADSVDLIVWPETAIPDYLFRRTSWERAIENLVAESGIPLVAGGLHVVWKSDDRQEYDYYNSAFFWDGSGVRAPEVYHKRYLVPIVERVPFVNPDWFDLRWFGGFGRGQPGPLYQTGIGGLGIIICYESAFEDLSRDYRRRGADFLVNITNDAWFGRTAAPYQHLAHLVMRAIENRSGIARAANSGITAMVDPLGRVSDATALGTETTVTAALVTSDVRTPYLSMGDWTQFPIMFAALALLGRAFIARRSRL